MSEPSVVVTGLRKIASEIDTIANWDEIKDSAVSGLVEGGVDAQSAEAIVSDLEKTASQPLSFSLPELSGILSDVASYVEELEAKIETSNGELMQKSAQLSKLASEKMTGEKGVLHPFIEKGFSEEEVRSISTLPEETLQKLAQATHSSPTPLGAGAGMAKDAMDPLLAFLSQ